MKAEFISVVIPTFNEKGNVVPLIKEILRVSEKNGFKVEVVVVDDDSPDKTGELTKKEFAGDKRVKVVIRKGERGLATAIIAGIKKSKGSTVVGMDADFNHPPRLIPKLIEGLEDSHLSIASRFVGEGGMYERKRYWLTLFYNLFLKIILGFPTLDNMSGFYAIEKSNLGKLSLSKIYRGYGDYHLRLLYFAKKSGYKISEIPVYYPKRKYGQSKSNLLRLLFTYTWVALKLSILGKD